MTRLLVKTNNPTALQLYNYDNEDINRLDDHTAEITGQDAVLFCSKDIINLFRDFERISNNEVKIVVENAENHDLYELSYKVESDNPELKPKSLIDEIVEELDFILQNNLIESIDYF